MKKILIAFSLLAVVSTANAQWHHHSIYHRGGCYNCGGGGNWVAPLIIGGIAGAVIARESQPVIVQQPQPVFVQRQTVCTEWKEIQQPDGQIYRERTCSQ